MNTLVIPRAIECLGALDWGFNGPGCLLWVAALPDGRLHVLREGAQAELQLGDAARFYPSDAALATWMAQAHNGQARIIYD